MTETSLAAWLGTLAVLLAASASGLALSRLLPWTPHARRSGVPVAAGLAVAPFLAGMAAVAVLALLPGRPLQLQLALACVLMAAPALAWLGRGALREPALPMPVPAWARLFGLIALLWCAGLVIDAVFMPLTQNDALEYAMVARMLFETRDLAAYPALDLGSTSGFYGPWTHPPLYVALLYLAYAVQGHADAPGLLRLVAPWFLFASAGLVWALGRQHSRTMANAAAAVMVGTPLLYLGAGSALIDALPVCGLALFLALLVGLDEARPDTRSMALGVVLGLSLWTHSQSILFLPLGAAALIAHHGLCQFRALARQLAIVIGLALAVAAWPYLRNVSLFGSPISDNPAVFALSQLQWPVYFEMARGYESWIEKVQYGIFKGWMMLEAYGAGFWLALPGIALVLRAWGGARALFTGAAAPATAPGQLRWLRAMIGIFGCYLGGVALSILVGTDLMIRNERYLLVMVPCGALFGGLFIAWLGEQAHGLPWSVAALRQWRPLLAAGTGAVMAAGLLYQVVLVGGHKARTYEVALADLGQPHPDKMRDFPSYAVVDYVARHTARDSLVLSMKPADMYYARRRMVSYLDPRMIPFYVLADARQARAFLRDMGVRYLHVPDYALPPMYRSTLEQIMARPELSQLVFSVGGHQLYDLAPAAAGQAGAAVDLSPRTHPWYVRRMAVIGGRVGVARFTMAQRPLGQAEVSIGAGGLPLFRREQTRLLVSGPWMEQGRKDGEGLVAVEGGREYRLDLALDGHAFGAVYLVQFDALGRPLALPRDGVAQPLPGGLSWSLLSRQRIGEVVLVEADGERRFARRFLTYPQTRSIGVLLEHRGATSLRVNSAGLRLVSAAPAPARVREAP